MRLGGSTINPRMDQSIRKNVALTEFALLASVIICLVLRFRLIFLLNIDVDEFSFLSQVYKYGKGTLGNPYFTFHVHLFSWLPYLPGDEVFQIIAGRAVMVFLGIGSCGLLYLITRLFISRIGALFSVLCYLSVSNVIVHGTSFRFDPICVFLFLMAVYLILRKHRSRLPAVAAGLCMAISLLVTLKSIFHLVTIAGIVFCLVIFSEKRKDTVLDSVWFLVSFAIGFLVLFLLHSYSLTGASVSAHEEYLIRLSRSGILFVSFMPERIYMFLAVTENLAPLAFGIAGISVLLLDIGFRRNIPGNVLLLFLLAPVFSLLFYQFNFPYFYVFCLSSGMAVSGVLPDRIAKKYNRNGSRFLLTCLVASYVLLLICFLGHYKKHSVDRTVTQREILHGVHEMFPEPVPYIDRCHMVSSFPMVGIQMTTWDMERYTKANLPIMHDLLVRRRPVFILANIAHLNLSQPWGTGREIFQVDPLLKEDFMVLRDNFIHHWGIVYVAGKRFVFGREDGPRIFENLIPGIYTIESVGNVWIDRVLYRPGSKIRLENKRYTVLPQSTPTEVVLRWGEDLYRPPDSLPHQPVFYGYYY